MLMHEGPARLFLDANPQTLGCERPRHNVICLPRNVICLPKRLIVVLFSLNLTIGRLDTFLQVSFNDCDLFSTAVT